MKYCYSLSIKDTIFFSFNKSFNRLRWACILVDYYNIPFQISLMDYWLEENVIKGKKKDSLFFVFLFFLSG